VKKENQKQKAKENRKENQYSRRKTGAGKTGAARHARPA
jgi:hypothetical protein